MATMPPLAGLKTCLPSTRIRNVPAMAGEGVKTRVFARSGVLIGPDERRLLVRLQLVAGRRDLEIFEAAQRLVNRRVGAMDPPVAVERQPCDGVLQQVEVSIG